MTAPVDRDALLALIGDLERRQALADALATAEHLPIGVDPAVTVARLLDRHGLLGILWRLHQAEWSGPDVAAVLTAIGLDEVDGEAAMLALDGITG